MFGYDRKNKDGKYFVLYKRDVKTEQSKGYGGRMLFDYCDFFEGPESAKEFAIVTIKIIFIKAIVGINNIAA